MVRNAHSPITAASRGGEGSRSRAWRTGITYASFASMSAMDTLRQNCCSASSLLLLAVLTSIQSSASLMASPSLVKKSEEMSAIRV